MRRSSRHVDDVRRYYESNTRWFARFGSDAGAASVHRALWAPGVRRLEDALRLSHRLVAEQLRARRPARCVIDLGCGIGGALADLQNAASSESSASPVLLLGLTLSHAQAQRAARRVTNHVHVNARVIEGNFLAAPFSDGCADFAYAIEAFAHAPDADSFFAEAARLLRPGARLMLIDDTLERRPSNVHEAQLLDAFVFGWRVPCVSPHDALLACAARRGLTHLHTQDLSDWLRLRALPVKFAATVLHGTRLLWRLDPVASATAGSIALQSLLACGMVRYRTVVFERTEASE